MDFPPKKKRKRRRRPVVTKPSVRTIAGAVAQYFEDDAFAEDAEKRYVRWVVVASISIEHTPGDVARFLKIDEATVMLIYGVVTKALSEAAIGTTVQAIGKLAHARHNARWRRDKR